MDPPACPETAAAGRGQQRVYLAYLLRLWRKQRGGLPVWRASLEDPHTGERPGFAGLAQLFAFLQRQASGRPGGWSTAM